ncbi:MAG: AAA family ATPase, partial [Mogibacterium sp.]|nr:AAA family ATPase [Mogibacterium sp.]
MHLQRKYSERIINWFNKENKALLITGARQVGKTHLIRHVVKEEIKYNLFEINLIETPEAVSVISQSETVEDLRIGLSVFSNEKLIPNNTVIFIDEVQKCKEIITKMKFLAEDNTFKYILSGSLLGVELNNIESAPVGYLEII